MIKQQMVQFAGHHGAKIVDMLCICLDPLAVRAGHDVDRRRRKRARTEQLCLFTAHHVMVIVARDAQTGNNPDIVANGR